MGPGSSAGTLRVPRTYPWKELSKEVCLDEVPALARPPHPVLAARLAGPRPVSAGLADPPAVPAGRDRRRGRLQPAPGRDPAARAGPGRTAPDLRRSDV